MLFNLVLKFLNLFSRKLTKDFLFVIFGSFFSGILELFGIMLILPFVQVVINPDVIYKSDGILSFIYKFSGVESTTSMIYIIGAMCGLSFILKDIFMLGFQYYQFGLVTKWRNELSEKFMDLYLGLNYRFHLRTASTAMINTLTSTVSATINGFLLQFLFLISYSIVAICLLVYMLLNFFEATIITSITLVLLIYIQVIILKRANYKINTDSVKVREENLVNLKQGIEAIKETKMFLRESYFSHLFSLSNRKVTNNERKMNLVQYIPLYLTEIIIILCIIIMVCTTIYFNDNGDGASFEGLAILVGIAFRLTPVINRIMVAYSQIRSSLESVNVLIEEYKYLYRNQDFLFNHDHNHISLNDSIELRNVCFSYNDVDVLLNINVKINKGEFVGVVGHSGSGKTTIVDILMGLLRPKRGELLIDGKVANEEDIRSLRAKIGYVPQTPFIGDMSVRQNIAYGLPSDKISDERIKNVLEIVDLWNFFREKPEGLNFKLGESGKSLSGGQKQRIAIARALYHDPDILVLDEATSALDVRSENSISNAISKLKGRTTVIAIAHRLSTIRNSDKVILVNWGEIEDIASFDELIVKNEGFKQLVELSKL
ncbi:ABC transporter ATP-binding protein [Vibrio spartinae]|uniref:Heterocyst differentiation ATP-binding protein HepA n=1 Tax=Vibrio spartinae TaxID=1918945 RepID=A0A1N6M2Y0_9VIBR|nr:ABC transporter ATP-binding protein [Vibrio spartinae]SIO93716.1 Heterocyst differentiation ATP-binding protein HepA [Vibrio spartinae]